MSDVVLYDHRFVGASDIISVATDRLAIASRVQRKIVTVGPSRAAISPAVNLAVAGYSTEQFVEPVKLASDATYIYALGVDTYMRFTNADTPVVQVTSAIRCDRPNWIIVNGSYLMCPYTTGGVQLLNIDGALVGLYYTGIIRASFGAFDGAGYLYVIDDTNGRGFVFQVLNSAIALVAKFDAANCRGIRGGFLDGNDLIVATAHRVIIFDVSDPEVPVFDDSTSVEAEITGIVSLGSGDYWLTTREYYAAQNPAFQHGSVSGVNTTAGLYLLHNKVGAVTGPGMNSLATVYAGADQTVALSAVALVGTASGPDVGSLTYLWSKTSGPGTATFVAPTALSTSVSFSVVGTYVLRLTATHGAYSTYDEVTIYVLATVNINYVVPAGTHYITLDYPIAITLVSQPPPSNPHTVTFAPDSGMSIVSGSGLVFTSANWNIPQYVTVTATTPTITDTNQTENPPVVHALAYTVTPVYGTPISGSIAITFTGVVYPACPVIPPWDSSFFEVFDLQVQQPIIVLATV